MEIVNSFGNLLELSTIVFLFVGTVGGIVIGALPGFTPTMGVALAVPFTFAMTPVDGLILLGAIYGGSVYGGSITAVLLNIPGAPANIGTILDGYPMAQKGQAQKALYISLISSFIGGVVSVIALYIFAPPLANFALRFGAAENFWIAIFGLTVLASLGTTKTLIKGLIGGGIGVLISTIGLSPTGGIPRFTFNMPELVGGVDLVATLIGLFAFSQALVFFEQLKGGKLTVLEKTKGVFIKAWKIVLRFPGLTFLSSILGTIVGVIPGAGGQVGSIIGYDQAKRFSKNRENFGKGTPEGVIAPEAANNATFGSALIPLLTLGIPGSPTAAVLLGGLLIHGLWPGPDLFTVNADITYTFITALFVAQFVMLFAGAVGIPVFSQVLKTPAYYLAPIIILLCIFGTFAVRNNPFDVYIMFICGILGYIALKLSIHPATIVLGIILGPIAERGLERGILLGEAKGSAFLHFFNTPISLGIIALIVVSIVSTVAIEFWKIKSRKKARAVDPTETSEEVAATTPHKSIPLKNYLLSRESIVAIFFVVTSLLVYIFYTSNLPNNGGRLPSFVLLSIAFLAIMQWFISRKYTPESLTGVPWLFILEVILTSLVIIILAQKVVGYYVASLLFMCYLPLRVMPSLGKKLNGKRVLVTVGITLCFVCFMYLSFGMLLQVPTPEGLFF